MGGFTAEKMPTNCFICLGKLPLPQSRSIKQEPALIRTASSSTKSIQYLFHYLKINSPRKSLNGEGGDQSVRNVKVKLCEECSPLHEKFSRLYRRLEQIKMEVTCCLESIHRRMAGKSDDCHQNDEIILDLELRKEAIKKCSHKLRKTTPRVRTKKLSWSEINEVDIKYESGLNQPHITTNNVAMENVPPNVGSITKCVISHLQVPDLSTHFEMSKQNFRSTTTTLSQDPSSSRPATCFEDASTRMPNSASGKVLDPSEHLHTAQFEGMEMECYPVVAPQIKPGLIEPSSPEANAEGIFGLPDQNADDSDNDMNGEGGSQSKKVRRRGEGRSTYVRIPRPIKVTGRVVEPQRVDDFEAGTQIKCNLCSKKFRKYTGYVAHHQTVHQKIRYRCPSLSCPNEFTLPFHYREHYRNVHNGEPIRCKQCNKSFMSSTGLRLHMGSVHLGARYPCQFCSKMFAQAPFRNRHMKTYHRGKTQ